MSEVRFHRPNGVGTILSHCFGYSVRAVRDHGCRVRWTASRYVEEEGDLPFTWVSLGRDFWTATEAKTACTKYAQENN